MVVSQKRAALDVVFERMENAGFGDFLGLVHDYRADHLILFEKIKKQILSIESYQEQNRGIDSIQLEREISRLSSTISRLSGKFEAFRKELFNDQYAGIPIKALYLNPNVGSPAVQDSGRLLRQNYRQSLDFERNFSVFHSYNQKYKDTFWASRPSFSGINPMDFQRISQSLNEIEEFRKSIPGGFDENHWLDFSGSILNSKAVNHKISKLQEAINQIPSAEIHYPLIFQAKEIKKLNKIQTWIEKADHVHLELRLSLFFRSHST
ncbi:hypothetical protein [Algoriphagus boritolerans]|uniref:hypothetical protein n=1 Tax=Algoriphagus boritolerans TaxID=308111 RepID=UPI000B1F0DAF